MLSTACAFCKLLWIKCFVSAKFLNVRNFNNNSNHCLDFHPFCTFSIFLEPIFVTYCIQYSTEHSFLHISKLVRKMEPAIIDTHRADGYKSLAQGPNSGSLLVLGNKTPTFQSVTKSISTEPHSWSWQQQIFSIPNWNSEMMAEQIPHGSVLYF